MNSCRKMVRRPPRPRGSPGIRFSFSTLYRVGKEKRSLGGPREDLGGVGLAPPCPGGAAAAFTLPMHAVGTQDGDQIAVPRAWAAQCGQYLVPGQPRWGGRE